MRDRLFRPRIRKHPREIDFSSKMILGRTEWCALPELGLHAIKAKIDTGAKTSAIHAFDITIHKKAGIECVKFKIHPLQGNNIIEVTCKAKIIDSRYVTSSNGHKEHRFVISTPIIIGEFEWPIELTLSNRDPLTYRLLLGRQALNNKVIIDPAMNLYQGRFLRSELKKIYAGG